MSTVMSTIARGATELWLAWDYGTSSMRAAYRFHEPGSTRTPTVTDIRDVKFNGEAASRQLLAFKDGKMIFGHQVQKMLTTPKGAKEKPLLTQDDVVSFLKVSIYPNLVAEALSREVSRQLKRLRESFDLPEDTDAHVIKVHVLAAHLREAYNEVLTRISSDLKNKSHHGSNGKLDLANMPKKIFFSVPGMWTPATNCCITAAAELAGLSNVTLVFEPFAAASYFLADLVFRDRKLFSKDAHILILDAGGGTSDVVAFKLEDDSAAGATTQMTVVGKVDGRLCGSEFVTMRFLDWLDSKIEADRINFPGGKTVLLAEMGLSAAEFKARAIKQFTPLKHSYRGPLLESYVVNIDGQRGAARKTIRIDIECDKPGCDHSTCDQMDIFFEPVLAENFEMVRERLEADKNIEAIIAMGGFAKSEYFMSRLTAEFGDMQQFRGPDADDIDASREMAKIHIQDGNESMSGYNHPVARGALLRHHEVAHRDLPTGDCFMIAQDAPWDPEEHGPQINHTIVKGEANPNQDWVKGLSKTIMPAGKRDVERATWIVRHADPGDTHQRLQTYWAPTGVKDGTPIFKKKEEASFKGQTVDGIMPCGIPLYYALPKPEELKKQYPEHILRDGKAPDPNRDDTSKDANFTGSSTSTVFSEQVVRRKTNQLRRAATAKPKKCENCGYDVTASATSSSTGDICKECVDEAFYAYMIRIIAQHSGTKVSFTIHMAKPDKVAAVERNEQLGPDDVIELHQTSFLDSNFNPNPLT